MRPVMSRSTLRPPTPIQRSFRLDDIDLAYFEWNVERRGREPTLLLAHATGFHARCWDRMIQHLGERHVLAVDMRGHGRSGGREIRHWEVFGEDLAGLVGGLELEGLVGVGHSMGGHALVDAAAAMPGAFRGLVLLDPVIGSPESYEQGDEMSRMTGGGPHPTARRRNRFASPQAMFERFESRPPYSLFDRDVLRDYCEYGLLPAPDGEGYVLACPPEIEASIYMTSRTPTRIFERVQAVDVPVLVVRAMEPPANRDPMDFSGSPTWPALARWFPDAADLSIPELTHFLPMQAPARMAAVVLEFEAERLARPAGVRRRV
jgi:pimeloyl-ACP methyl ester carboxylesterase